MDRGFMNNLSDPAEGAAARHDWTVQKASPLFHARRFEWNPFAGVTTENRPSFMPPRCRAASRWLAYTPIRA